jgi:pentatricopeptide repeat protein
LPTEIEYRIAGSCSNRYASKSSLQKSASYVWYYVRSGFASHTVLSAEFLPHVALTMRSGPRPLRTKLGDGQAEAAEQLLQRMRSCGVQPNVFTYNTLMDVYAKCGDADKALQLLRRMQAEEMECDVITFGAAMDACSKGGAWESALQLLPDMRKLDVAPNVNVWNALLDALGKAGQLDRMLKQFAAMKAEGCTPNSSTYNTLTSVLAVAGEHALVDRFYSEALASGAIDSYHLERVPAANLCRRGFDPRGSILDLHELNVPLALAAVRQELQLAAEGKRARPLQIITGKGTTTGITPIRDAVAALLQERKIEYTVLAHNAGVVVVP